MRLDKYLKVSRLIKRRTVANEACDAGRVLVNDKPAKASVQVKTGDTMELSMSDGTAHANGKTYSCTKLPEYMQDILNQGGLIASLNREEE